VIVLYLETLFFVAAAFFVAARFANRIIVRAITETY
jgi:hypothetical protein